ncbi:MAG TPA: DUF3617 family protein [Terracidiphilus sp.]|jgi:hypothetical protein|nr:DUF3617 family protein [Terracidiphilus sp.]
MMRRTSICIALVCLAFAVAVLAVAQAGRQPGLWEVTSKMTWQQSPFPGGSAGGPGGGAPMSPAPHSTQVCLTQAMIDKYGGPIPQTHECKVVNINKTATSMTADWICSGHMSGKGTMESSWADGNRTTGKIHFAGTMQMGQAGSKPVEWTNQMISVYKGPDCGAVKPVE